MTDAGKVEFAAVLPVMCQQSGIIAWNGKKQRGPVAFNVGVHHVGSGAAWGKNAGGSYREGEITSVPKTIGKKEFGHAVAPVVLIHAKNAFGVELRANHHIVLKMNTALGRSSAAGGVQPKSGIIPAGRLSFQMGRSILH